MRLNKIHHEEVICSDYERSKQFYIDVLELRIVSGYYCKEHASWKADCCFVLFNDPDRLPIGLYEK